MRKRIAIVGGGIAGVTAAWQLARLAAEGACVEAVLFEASSRLGGIVETVHKDGFLIECGPDAWVTEKPWAHELAKELGLGGEIVYSNDAARKTYVLESGELIALPDGMRMMVPTDFNTLDRSSLFSDAARAAYRAEVDRASELKSSAPYADESVASFVQRHFGTEVLEKVGAPLLSGVFGGNVNTLSARAVMAPFVAMEREHGSLIVALRERAKSSTIPPVFTSLHSGVGTLIDRMMAEVPSNWLELSNAVIGIERTQGGWRLDNARGRQDFNELVLAVPSYVASRLLRPTDPLAAELMQMETSTAVIAAFGFAEHFDLPAGFGFLVPPDSPGCKLLAATFTDQKFEGRAPTDCRLLRAFFGGPTADSLLKESEEHIASLALKELQTILGSLPEPAITVVRRWPRALPQYAVGHLHRMHELFRRVSDIGSLWLLGNGYRGVGLPDLIRDARAAAYEAVGQR